MKKIRFNDYEEMACIIADELDEITIQNEFYDIAIIAKYEDAREIIRELLCIGYEIRCIQIHDVECDGYDDEYIISLTNTDNEHLVWCEPMRRDNSYINDSSHITYILDNCSSKVIAHCECDRIYEVAIGEKDDDCEDCELKSQDKNSNNSESTYISKDRDGKPTGFMKSWFTEEDGVRCYSSYSHYSNNMDALRRIAQEFGVKL